MNIADLIAHTRLLLGDSSADDPFYPDGEIMFWLTEAHIETAYRIGYLTNPELPPHLNDPPDIPPRYLYALPLFAAMRGFQKAGDQQSVQLYEQQFDSLVQQLRRESVLTHTHDGVVSEHTDAGPDYQQPVVPGHPGTPQNVNVTDRSDRKLGQTEITNAVDIADRPQRQLGQVTIPDLDVQFPEQMDITDRYQRALGTVTVDNFDGTVDLADRPERQLGQVELADNPNRNFGQVTLAEPAYLYLGADPEHGVRTIDIEPTELYVRSGMRPHRHTLAVYNDGAGPVYWGGYDVTVDTGFPLLPGDSFVVHFRPGNVDPVDVWAVAPSPTNVRVLDLF